MPLFVPPSRLWASAPVVLAFLLLAAPPAAASTFWKFVTPMKIASSQRVVNPARAVDDDPATTAWLTARPGRPAVLLVDLGEGEMLKGIRMRIGSLPKGARCKVEYAWDERDWHWVWYLDGPHPLGLEGFQLPGWPAARLLRLTLECSAGTEEVIWVLNEIEVYAEE